MGYHFPVKNCFECPNYDHSGAFTEGGAIPLCNAIQGSRYHYRRRELPFVFSQENGKRVATGEIPSWCPLPENCKVTIQPSKRSKKAFSPKTEEEVKNLVKSWIFNDHSFDKIGSMVYNIIVKPYEKEIERLKKDK